MCLRVLEPGFKQLESREDSKTNASDISIYFHFDIALAEPDKQQTTIGGRYSTGVVVAGYSGCGRIIERMLQPSWCTHSSSVLKIGSLRDLPVPRLAGDEEKHGQVQQLMSAQVEGEQNAIMQWAERLPPSVQQTHKTRKKHEINRE